MRSNFEAGFRLQNWAGFGTPGSDSGLKLGPESGPDSDTNLHWWGKRNWGQHGNSQRLARKQKRAAHR